MAKDRETAEKRGTKTLLSWVASILFLLVLVSAFSVGYLTGKGGGTTTTGTVTGQTFNGAALQGDAKAPVTIIEYSDFQCPYCGRFVQDSYPQIKEQYIDTGKAKLIFKDFPLSFHPYAQKAAVAGKCVLEQGNDKFWKYHDAVFTNQAQLNDDNIKLWASQAGADMTKFNACVASGKMDAIIQQEQQEGQQAGVTGTPSFTINGKLVVGAQPFSAFQTAIDAALAAGK